eukprot:gene4075-20254_t
MQESTRPTNKKVKHGGQYCVAGLPNGESCTNSSLTPELPGFDSSKTKRTLKKDRIPTVFDTRGRSQAFSESSSKLLRGIKEHEHANKNECASGQFHEEIEEVEVGENAFTIGDSFTIGEQHIDSEEHVDVVPLQCQVHLTGAPVHTCPTCITPQGEEVQGNIRTHTAIQVAMMCKKWTETRKKIQNLRRQNNRLKHVIRTLREGSEKNEDSGNPIPVEDILLAEESNENLSEDEDSEWKVDEADSSPSDMSDSDGTDFDDYDYDDTHKKRQQVRHIMAVSHFNENLHREAQKDKNGKEYFKVSYPKYKPGEEAVKPVPVPPSYKNDQYKLQEDLVAEQACNRADRLPKRKAPSCKKSCTSALVVIAGLLSPLFALLHYRHCKDHKPDTVCWGNRTLNKPLHSNVPEVHRYKNGLSQRPKSKRKFFKSRISRYRNSNCTFQLLESNEYLLLMAGDVHPNPGPVKRSCSVCHRAVAKTHRALTCNGCAQLCHIGHVSVTEHKRLEKIKTWYCPTCTNKQILESKVLLPFADCSNLQEFFHCAGQTNDNGDTWDAMFNETIDQQFSTIDRTSTETAEERLLELRNKDNRNVLICHQNINSIQNKIEDLKELNKSLSAQILFITETKIDNTYPDEQFKIEGYRIFREDRKKGGGGIMAYVTEQVISKKLKTPKKCYEKFEVLACSIELPGVKLIVLCLYRPPKAIGKEHFLKVEKEINDIVGWAAMQGNKLVVLGDLNLNRLQPESTEGKILIGLEEVHNLQCMIERPTRVTDKTQTLIDVILTNIPDNFQLSGELDSGLSDHFMTFGLMNTRIKQHKRKIITFRSKKNLNHEELKKDIEAMPWQVTETFDSVDDKCHFWHELISQIIDKHLPLKRMRTIYTVQYEVF